MDRLKDKTVLISGCSIAGLSAAWWMSKLGYKVTVVEIADQPRTSGAAIDVRGATIAIVKRMGIYDELKAHSLQVEMVEFKNENDVTEGHLALPSAEMNDADEEIEIERDKFLGILFNKLKNDVDFIFNNSITALNDGEESVIATFKKGPQLSFDLVFGCDGLHSIVRNLCFGNEAEYTHFLKAYFSITIVNKLLVKQKTMQMYNVPNKAIMLNAYNNKTDIIFCFFSEKELSYHYRDTAQQKQIVAEQFAGESWRAPELLEETQLSDNFYFDKFCQIKMPTWTKGRIALIGDAGYCASPAAGMGASLSITGAATLADALDKNNGDFKRAFEEYNQKLRPFIKDIQSTAENNLRENFIPATQDSIDKRNKQHTAF